MSRAPALAVAGREQGAPRAAHPAPLAWLRSYPREALAGDLVAGTVVAALLVPQSMAYAQLAGLPPQAGLYASILPVVLYALLGSSPTLAVGPVAMVSLMTASALTPLAAGGSAAYAALALQLALLVGLLQALFGLLRLGGLVHLLSHAVVAGFTSGAALLIALGQLRPLLGLKGAAGDRLLPLLAGLTAAPVALSWGDVLLGPGSLLLLLALDLLPLPTRLARWRKLGPLAVVLLAALAAQLMGRLAGWSVSLVGQVPAGLPRLAWPAPDLAAWQPLLLPALVIALAGFAESHAMAQAMAGRHRAGPRPNRELLALGAANLGAAVSGAFPVTGGFSRSMVNLNAGARTPVASILSAGLMAVSAVWLAPLLGLLPRAALAAVILAAVYRLVAVPTLRRLWAYDRAEAALLLGSLGAVLLLGIERGLVAGLAATLLLWLRRAGHPHLAVLGRVPGTEHFRNVRRHAVTTWPELLLLRPDASLTSLNIGDLRDRILAEVAGRPALRHLVLVCSAVNSLEGGALLELEAMAADLAAAGVRTHLAEVKGPVQDRLDRAGRTEGLGGGRTFLSAQQAVETLLGARAALSLEA